MVSYKINQVYVHRSNNLVHKLASQEASLTFELFSQRQNPQEQLDISDRNETELHP